MMRGLSRLIVIPIAAFAGSGMSPLPARPVHRDASSTVVLRFGGSGPRTIDMRTISGAIHVTTADRADVSLTISRHTDAESESDVATADRDVRLVTSTAGPVVEAIVHDGDQVCGESNNSRRESWWNRRRYDARVDLTAVVPAGTRVRLCTINGDAVVATGSFADFDVSNVNGRIELSGVRGSGRAVTVNGPVQVVFAEAPRDASEFRTVNGDVTVTFPRDLSADLRLKTFHGALLTDFETQPLPVQPQVARGDANGRYVYKSEGLTRVRVGRGGPELTFDTLNGDVRILRGAR
jgi:hypothetical protein